MSADLAAIAKARSELHRDHASTRRLTQDHDLVGLVGEAEAANYLGAEVDLASRPAGDGGIDFHIALYFSVDVKTTRRHDGDLLVEAKSANADIYVLAHFVDGKATLIGWEWGKHVKEYEPYDVGGHGIVSHKVPRRNLRPMDTLKARLTRRQTP
ncbi:MAG: hypothetical protein EBR82_62465 [Caulobacteraceae bacterium]|nr:hypothetical protein [Caulobacteraceae bacterium]